MTTNPYAPPKSNVDDAQISQPVETAPPLWNPKAAIGWSLLFSPLFGALVHMKNWQALGEPQKATESKTWAISIGVFFLVMMVFSVLAPESRVLDLIGRVSGIALLVAWYSASAKWQVAAVKDRFNGVYPKRGWGLPLLYALLGVVVFFAVIFALAFAAGMFEGDAY